MSDATKEKRTRLGLVRALIAGQLLLYATRFTEGRAQAIGTWDSLARAMVALQHFDGLLASNPDQLEALLETANALQLTETLADHATSTGSTGAQLVYWSFLNPNECATKLENLIAEKHGVKK